MKFESVRETKSQNNLHAYPRCLSDQRLCYWLIGKYFVCLFDLILYVPSTIFQLNREMFGKYRREIGDLIYDPDFTKELSY